MMLCCFFTEVGDLDVTLAVYQQVLGLTARR